MKKIFAVLIVLLLAFSFASCKKEEKEVEIELNPPSIGDTAPDFSAKDINGAFLTLSSQKGKVVIVEFGATWCPPCKDLAIELSGLYKKYKDKGLVVFAVVPDEEEEANVRFFADQYGITYPMLFAERKVFRLYGISGIPASFIINREGKITNVHFGYTTSLAKRLASDIEKAL